MKLIFSRHIGARVDLLFPLEAPAGLLGVAATPNSRSWQKQFLSQRSIRLGGATEQIRRNTISERVLGRPREPEPSSAATFRAASATHR